MRAQGLTAYVSRYRKWETDKVLSFVPPDGQFKLMSYRAALSHYQAMPLQVKPQILASKNGGKRSGKSE